MATTLFVYGTLKRGCCNQRFLKDQQFLGEAQTLPRYRLYRRGRYPCLVEDLDNGVAVRGELWRVDADVLARLDQFEDAPRTFVRREVALDGAFGSAWAYFYRGSVEALHDCVDAWSEPAV